MRLFVASATSSLPAQVDPGSSTATIEPQGVLQLGGDTFSAVEGTQVSSLRRDNIDVSLRNIDPRQKMGSNASLSDLSTIKTILSTPT